MRRPLIKSILAIAEAKVRLVLKNSKKQREQAFADLRLENLTLRGVQKREIEITDKSLSQTVQQVIEVHRQVAKDEDCLELFNPEHSQALRQRIEQCIAASLGALRDRHAQDLKAAGEIVSIPARIYDSIAWRLKDDIDMEFDVLRTEWAAHSKDTPSTRKGYRDEVNVWRNGLGLTVKDAAKRLGVCDSTLKSIMSSKGEKKYGDKTRSRVLKLIGGKPE